MVRRKLFLVVVLVLDAVAEMLSPLFSLRALVMKAPQN